MSLPRVGRREPEDTDFLQWADRPSFSVFGPMSVVADGRAVRPGPPRQRAVLALLLANARQVVPVSTMIGSIWEDRPPAQVTATLQSYVSRLRVLLAGAGRAPALQWRAPGYRLVVRPDQTDVGRFELAVAHGREALRAGRAAVAERSLAMALRLWTGRPYAELAGYRFAAQEAARLAQVRLAAVEGRADACFHLGQDGELLEALGQEVAQHPLRESLVLRLMRAQYRVGRQAEALRVYERSRALLADELGVDPGRDLQELHRAILRQDPSLDPAARPVVPSPRRELVPTSRPGPLWLPFVGRRDLVERLARWSGERGRAVLLTGAAGTGKSRLLLELADRLAADGTEVLWACCPCDEEVPSLWPWRQVLRRLPARAARIARAVAEGEPVVAPSFEVADAVCESVLAAAGERRVAVVVEDVQWADAGSLAVLRLLARQVHRSPLLLVITARGHEPADTAAHPDLPGTLAVVGGSPATTVIRLAGLSSEESAALVLAAVGEQAGVAAALHERTGGNPLLLTQLLVSSVSGVPEGIPDVVRSTVRQWLARLPRPVRDELELRAVLGGHVDRPRPADVPDPLRAAIGAGLLTPTEGRLAHPLVGEVLLTDLPGPRLAQLHSAATETLITRALDARPADARAVRIEPLLPPTGAMVGPTDTEPALRHTGATAGLTGLPDTEPILRHAAAVAELAGVVRAVGPLLRAARFVERAGAAPQALDWLHHAVGLVGRGRGRTAEIEVVLQLHRVRLGAAVHGYRSDVVETAHARAEELCPRVRPSLRAAVLRARCLTRLVTGQYEEVDGPAGELDEMGERGDLAAAVSACLSRGAARHEQGRLDEALAQFDRAAALADAAGLRPGAPATVAVGGYLAFTHWFQGSRDTAAARSRALLSTTAAAGVPPVARVFALYVDSVLAALGGDVERAWRSGRAGAALATRGGPGYWRDMTAVPHGWALVHRGQVAAGLRLIRAALTSSARSEVWLRRALNLRLLADAEHRAGHDRDACRTLRTMVVHARCRREHLYLRPGTRFALPPL
ncbi:BTAD domain-containing putative transcriptional regulator [Saccharothrix luteola]|uniref:BTAD domain-containing putative transcriptional regulator n=1 Tax=Saccharothrix luteola TaxID=2893018 RepID=UPI001E4A933E|nr:BTAD domain-containing putative transcriptional regulator [Saccharothrix luteola]MCC8246431.1 AAA family ATPase [Saccharothrix luteola]